MENSQKNSAGAKKTYQIIIGVLLLIIVVLSWQLIVTKSSVNTVVVEKEKTIIQNQQLQSELDALLAEHDKIKQEYGYLTGQMSEKDSMIMVQAREIEQLIASQADYGRIKKKLDYLRNITQNYVNQIDSLYTINAQLTQENVQIRGDLTEEQRRTFELTQQTENLNTKISSASFLKAYSISATAYNNRSGGKESATDKAKRTDKIKVCFTIGENSLVIGGQKDVYLRIARPDDNLILTQGSYSWIYQGNRIQYSAKTVINYAQKSINACVEYTRGDIELPSGIYHIALFADDHELGQTTIVLK